MMKGKTSKDDGLQLGPFVSYAREDQAFVRRLHEALRQRQRDTWVDWEGIYPTEEWMAKIRSAIDSAQAFVFVISSESVTSTVCREEIDHAVKQNKRIIPIVAKEVDAALVHPAVAKLNWLHVRASDDFDAQVDALIAAMDMDLEWLHSHTRLLVRAEEWQGRGRDGSLLLRGADLRNAERWLLSSDAAKERVPTPAQTQFIVTSRQAETRRRNVQRTIAVAALVVLSALSIYSWIQKNTAEQQRNLAVSRLLAARAQSLGEEDNPTPLLLSALAMRYSHSPEAQSSLARLLIPTVPLARTLWSPFRGEPMDCLAFHRDGVYAAGSNLYGVTVWHMGTGQVAAFVADEDGLDCPAFGPRDDLVAIADEGRVHLWEWGRNQRRTLGGQPNEQNARTAFSADGRSVFVASGGQVTEWDLAQNTSRVVISQEGDFGYAFSPDGKRLAAVDVNQFIKMWDLETGQLTAEVQGPGGFAASTALAFSGDGHRLAAGGRGVIVWDVQQDGGVRQVNEMRNVIATAVTFRLDNTTLVVGTHEGEIIPWDFKTSYRPTFPLRGSKYAVKAVAFTPDGRLLATSGRLGSVWLWDLSRQYQHILERRLDVEVRNESGDQNGRMLALKRGRGSVLWDSGGTRTLIDVTDLPDRRVAIAFSARASVMAVLDGDRHIRLWDTATGKPTGQLATTDHGIERIAMSPTGTFVAGVNSSGTRCRRYANRDDVDQRRRRDWTGRRHRVQPRRDAAGLRRSRR